MGTLFAQNRVLPNKQWSVGLNYRHQNYNSVLFDDRNYFGLSFEHIVYKRFYLNTCIEYSSKKYHNEFDGTMLSPLFGPSPPLKSVSDGVITNVLLPIDFKYIFLNNKKNTLQSFAYLGIENQYYSDKSDWISYYADRTEEETIRKKYIFTYLQFGGGLNINIYKFCLSIEMFCNSNYYQNYNFERTYRSHNKFNLKAGVHYVFGKD